MKTVLLFSSFFYLLGLKMGNTIEVLKRVVVPVKTIISAPATKPERSEKTYYFKSEGTSKSKKVEKKEDAASTSAVPQTKTGNSVQHSAKGGV